MAFDSDSGNFIVSIFRHFPQTPVLNEIQVISKIFEELLRHKLLYSMPYTSWKQYGIYLFI